MSCCSPDQSKALKILGERKQEYLNYESSEKLTWCSGCGDYGIQKALQRALVLEKIAPHNLLWCFDIGCHGNGSDKINTYTLHGLHGRIISAAAGAAVANPNIKVIAEAGDGGTFSEGPNHLIHAVRNNYPMVFVLHNNENYGLTIGQASSMTRMGQSMNGSPDGPTAEPMNACQFVLGLKPTFVARVFSGDVDHMTGIMRQALNHDGFAFVEVLQLCPTFNKATSQTWFLDRIRYIEDLKGYDETDVWAAMKAAGDLDKEIMVGVLYRDKNSKSFLQRVSTRASQKKALTEEVESFDVSPLLEALK